MKQYNPKQFLPPSSTGSFHAPWDSLRLKSNFKSEVSKNLEDCKDDKIEDVKLRYIMGILQDLVPEYGTEYFDLGINNELFHCVPHHESHPGLFSTYPGNKVNKI